MPLPILLFIVVPIIAIGIYKLITILEIKDRNLILLVYLLLAMIYFVIARRLISFIVDFDHSSLGSALVELIIFSALYLSIVLSAVLGILVHLKDRNAVMEFAKSFAVLVVLFPIGVEAF